MNKIFFSIIFLFFLSFQISFAQDKVIEGGIVNGGATYLPKPDYPQEAKDFCADGTVEVQILIGEDGKVISAEAISGDELLRDSAVEAAKKAKFRMGHASVKTKGKLVYNFVSEKKCVNAGVVNKNALIIPKPQLQNTINSCHLNIKEPIEINVQIVIDATGNVTNARALNGHPLLRGIFVNFARQAKFKPININSAPFFVTAILVYKINPDGEVYTDIDDEIVLGEALNLSKPIFPSFTGKIGNNRSVLVEIVIDEDGNVLSAEAISGHPMLKAMSVAAARHSKFSQTTISGVPVKAKALLTYEYILADELIVNVVVNSIEPQK